MTDHPLVAWMKRQKPPTKPYLFADDIGMPRRTLYSHLSGNLRNPSLNAMRRIEGGTGGKVTIKAQTDWFRALGPVMVPVRRKRAAKTETPPYEAPEPPLDEETIFDEPETPDDPVDDDADNGPLEDEIDGPGPKIVPF